MKLITLINNINNLIPYTIKDQTLDEVSESGYYMMIMSLSKCNQYHLITFLLASLAIKMCLINSYNIQKKKKKTCKKLKVKCPGKENTNCHNGEYSNGAFKQKYVNTILTGRLFNS